MQSTPVRGSGDTGDLPLVDSLDQQLQVLQGRLRQHAVAEVEDVAGTAAGPPEDVLSALADELGGSQQDGRVEVALHAASVADAFPAAVQRHPPVQGAQVRAA